MRNYLAMGLYASLPRDLRLDNGYTSITRYPVEKVLFETNIHQSADAVLPKPWLYGWFASHIFSPTCRIVAPLPRKTVLLRSSGCD